jgi:hypothetical protein
MSFAYEGSLLQEAFPDRFIKAPVSTTAEHDVVVFFGRQTEDAPLTKNTSPLSDCTIDLILIVNLPADFTLFFE